MPLSRFLTLALLWTVSQPFHGQAGDPHVGNARLKKEWELCLGKDPGDAIKGCTAVLNSHLEPPENQAIAWNARSLAYTAKNENAQALKDIDGAIRLNPAFAAALSNRGNLRAASHQYDQAIADFSEALRLAPQPQFDPATTLANRASAYNNQGDYQHALDDANEVLRLRPNDAQAFFSRGTVYSNLADYVKALADYDKSLELNPGTTAVLEAREKIAYKAGRANRSAVESIALPPCPVPEKHQPSYAEDTVDNLKKAVPDLHGIRVETVDDAQAEHLVSETANAIAVMLPKIPNLIAREDVTRWYEAHINIGSQAGLARGNRGGRGLGDLSSADDSPDRILTTYTYRITHPREAAASQELDELRTDANNRPLAPGNDVRNIGFAAAWLLFAPGNLAAAHFRYLGTQKIAGHETFVLAFTQIPEKRRLATEVGPLNARCITYMQGIAWVDRVSFHIIRMQTDLLTPLPVLPLMKLRSVLKYTEVNIPERALSLWLPSDVEIRWDEDHQADRETHHYSKYRLFTGTARILPTTEGSPDPPKP